MLLLEITLADRNDVGCSLHRPMHSQPNGERTLGENGGRHAKDQNQHSYGEECFFHGILHLPLSSGNLVSRNSKNVLTRLHMIPSIAPVLGFGQIRAVDLKSDALLLIPPGECGLPSVPPDGKLEKI